jgi:hypothetical protein
MNIENKMDKLTRLEAERSKLEDFFEAMASSDKIPSPNNLKDAIDSIDLVQSQINSHKRIHRATTSPAYIVKQIEKKNVHLTLLENLLDRMMSSKRAVTSIKKILYLISLVNSQINSLNRKLSPGGGFVTLNLRQR